MLAMVLGVILFWAAIRDRAAGTRRAIASFVLVLLGIGLSVLQLVPPPDSGFAVGWKFDLDLPHLAQTLAAVWKSYVPLPAPDYHFWGTNFISDPRWQALLSIILLAFGLLLFGRQPLPLFLYGVGTLGILVFTYVKYPGSLRHHGHLYLLFIASLWLASVFPEKKKFSYSIKSLANFCRGHRDRVITILLVAHLVAGMTAASLDLFYPFSASKDAVRFIKQHRLDRLLIVGHTDDAALSIAGCLGCPIYYPASRRMGSFLVLNQERKTELELGELLAQARGLNLQHRQDALLLLNYELPPGEFPVIPVQQFTRSLEPAENYYLYLVPASGPRAGE
jgi:hypothetical protein